MPRCTSHDITFTSLVTFQLLITTPVSPARDDHCLAYTGRDKRRLVQSTVFAALANRCCAAQNVRFLTLLSVRRGSRMRRVSNVAV